jgi:hypothetical protein
MPPKKAKKTATKKPAAVPCPHGLPEMCAAINDWAEEWFEWGLEVKAIVDECCDTGDPSDKVPPPPPPPFK